MHVEGGVGMEEGFIIPKDTQTQWSFVGRKLFVPYGKADLLRPEEESAKWLERIASFEELPARHRGRRGFSIYESNSTKRTIFVEAVDTLGEHPNLVFNILNVGSETELEKARLETLLERRHTGDQEAERLRAREIFDVTL